MRAWALLLFVGFGMVLAGANARSLVGADEESSRQVVHGGVLYVYGERMTAPYAFTIDSGDTLWVNGIRLFPRKRLPHTLPPVSAGQIERHELAMRADSATRDAGSHEEKVRRMADVYRNSSLVETGSVRVTPCGFEFRWITDDPLMVEESVIVGADGAVPHPAAEVSREAMNGYVRSLNAGCFVAIGEGYEVTAPSFQVDRISRLLERLEKGESLTDAEVHGTPLDVPRFRRDVLEAGP